MKPKPETFEWHPVACMFPIPTGKEFDAMVEDLKTNGLREKGKVWLDPETGKYVGIDGRFREKACEAAGVEFSFEILELRDEAAVVAYILSKNLARRHMNESQRAMLGARLLPIFSEEAEKRKKSGIVADLPDGEKGRAREHVAALLNVSPRLVQDAKTLLENDSPELIQKVENGENSVSAVLEIVKNLSEEEQEKVFAGGKKTVTETAAKIRKDKKATKAAEKSDSKSAEDEESGPNGKQTPPVPPEPPAPEQTERAETPPPAQAPAVETQIPEWLGAMPEWLREGLERHQKDLPNAESVRITIKNGDGRNEIILTARKGRAQPAPEQPKPADTKPDDDTKGLLVQIGRNSSEE